MEVVPGQGLREFQKIHKFFFLGILKKFILAQSQAGLSIHDIVLDLTLFIFVSLVQIFSDENLFQLLISAVYYLVPKYNRWVENLPLIQEKNEVIPIGYRMCLRSLLINTELVNHYCVPGTLLGVGDSLERVCLTYIKAPVFSRLGVTSVFGF